VSIAKEVGVDPSLVSRVLRADPSARISPLKRAHILEVVERTGYRPNRVAKSLRMRETHLLAMLTPDITNPFHSWLFRAVEARANRLGYHVILCNTDDDAARSVKLVSTLCEGHVDGLLLANAREEDAAIEMLRHRNIPYVLMNRRRKDKDDPWFGTDSERVGRIGARHLLSLGHSNVAYIDGDITVEQLSGRRDGFVAEMSETGSPVTRSLMSTGLTTRMGARRAVEAMLVQPIERRPTAVFVPRSTLVDGVMDAVHAAGLTVPGDISILGFNAVSDPVVTSIRVPIEQIGERAVEFLIGSLNSELVDGEPHQITFETTMVDRATTARLTS
jgi:LacI family transcriptional regulator